MSRVYLFIFKMSLSVGSKEAGPKKVTCLFYCNVNVYSQSVKQGVTGISSFDTLCLSRV